MLVAAKPHPQTMDPIASLSHLLWWFTNCILQKHSSKAFSDKTWKKVALWASCPLLSFFTSEVLKVSTINLNFKKVYISKRIGNTHIFSNIETQRRDPHQGQVNSEHNSVTYTTYQSPALRTFRQLLPSAKPSSSPLLQCASKLLKEALRQLLTARCRVQARRCVNW